MKTEDLSRLSAASVAKPYSPESDVDWSVSISELIGSVLPAEAISLFGSRAIDELGESEVAELAKHEVAAMFSAFIRFEGVLNQALSRAVRLADPVSAELSYTLHVIEEEAKHSRMFSTLVASLGTGGYSPKGFHGLIERIAEPIIAQSKTLFHYSMFAVESITDTFLAEILKVGTKYPALRDVCRIHRIEEARHMSFAGANFMEEYGRAGWASRLATRVLAPIVAAAIYEVLVPPSVYLRSGIARSRLSAWALWVESHRSERRMALRRQSLDRVWRLTQKAGAVGSGSRLGWRALGVHFSQG